MPLRTKAILIPAVALLAVGITPAKAACIPYRAAPVTVSSEAAFRTADGRLRIVGYNDMAEMLRPMAERFGRHHAGFRFDLLLEGTRTAPPALTDGTSLVAPMGAEWEKAPLAAYRARYSADPVMVRVAHASLSPRARSSPSAVIVHRENRLHSLSMPQVREVFTGVLTSWTQLARPGLGEIHPIGFAETTAIGDFLRRVHFGGRAFKSTYVGKLQSREVVDAVAADPQAIGLANLNHVDARVRIVGLSPDGVQRPSFGTRADILAGRYPFDRHLMVYARRDEHGRIEPLAREWLKLMLSCEGQAIIAAGSLGYLPLNDREAARELHKLT